MTNLASKKAEKWRGFAAMSLFYAIALSIFGAICVRWIAPRINIHSTVALVPVLGILFVGIANAVAGGVGLVSASVLFLRDRVISWHGIASTAIVVLFFFLTW